MVWYLVDMPQEMIPNSVSWFIPQYSIHFLSTFLAGGDLIFTFWVISPSSSISISSFLTSAIVDVVPLEKNLWVFYKDRWGNREVHGLICDGGETVCGAAFGDGGGVKGEMEYNHPKERRKLRKLYLDNRKIKQNSTTSTTQSSLNVINANERRQLRKAYLNNRKFNNMPTTSTPHISSTSDVRNINNKGMHISNYNIRTPLPNNRHKYLFTSSMTSTNPSEIIQTPSSVKLRSGSHKLKRKFLNVNDIPTIDLTADDESNHENNREDIPLGISKDYFDHGDQKNENSNRQTTFGGSKKPSTSTTDSYDLQIIQDLKVMLDSNNELVKSFRMDNVFGNVQAVVYTIEFQKRGLPHIRGNTCLMEFFTINDFVSNLQIYQLRNNSLRI
ncbi:hypothetical protein L2E82_37083 [Cichorium intybus]|uniref:Uncharacterized protein n=1 Tax=Cichorium intybus TaxID=13427 RepID=A0ACB9AEW6_CICIN|nr:hypothetical protein L2E82_37083 [Cichorium intybus]